MLNFLARNKSKKYVEIFWTPFLPETFQDELNIILPAPRPFYPILYESRKNSKYLKCPAIKDQCKNDFVISSGFDLNITVNREKQEMSTDRYGQRFFDNLLVDRKSYTVPENPYLLTLPSWYLFYTESDVEIECTDLPIITSVSASNFKVIRGGFNIGKWIRPLELAVEVIDDSKPVSLKVDDPLFLIRFKTPNNIPVKLTRVLLTSELRSIVNSCANVKYYRPDLKLKKLYELAEDHIKSFLHHRHGSK